VLSDLDFLAVGKSRFHLFQQSGNSSKTPDQLLTALGALILSAMVNND
jgi:hypothetical protein